MKGPNAPSSRRVTHPNFKPASSRAPSPSSPSSNVPSCVLRVASLSRRRPLTERKTEHERQYWLRESLRGKHHKERGRTYLQNRANAPPLKRVDQLSILVLRQVEVNLSPSRCLHIFVTLQEVSLHLAAGVLIDNGVPVCVRLRALARDT